jgi:hypothetical protein
MVGARCIDLRLARWAGQGLHNDRTTGATNQSLSLYMYVAIH